MKENGLKRDLRRNPDRSSMATLNNSAATAKAIAPVNGVAEVTAPGGTIVAVTIQPTTPASTARNANETTIPTNVGMCLSQPRP